MDGYGYFGRIRRCLRRNDFRDTEVKQFNFAFRSHEDVLRFYVSMHDQIAVGVTNGIAHHEEELQAFGKREPMLVAKGVNRNAVNVVHDEIGQARFGLAAV